MRDQTVIWLLRSKELQEKRKQKHCIVATELYTKAQATPSDPDSQLNRSYLFEGGLNRDLKSEIKDQFLRENGHYNNVVPLLSDLISGSQGSWFLESFRNRI